MRRQGDGRRLLGALLLALLFCLTAVPEASANSAEPPRLIIIVERPPDDLSVQLQFGQEEGSLRIPLERRQTAWEAQYRFVYGIVSEFRPSLDDVRLLASHGGQTYELPLPVALASRYNHVVTLDLERLTVTDGQTLARTATLVSLRVGLTLLIEGLLFYLFLYRRRSSWAVFLLVNLATQGWLNIALNQSFADSYLLLSLIAFEIIVTVVELAAFLVLVREHHWLRTVLYVLLANAVSFAAGGLLISWLPV